jgi:hypothetical protein
VADAPQARDEIDHGEHDRAQQIRQQGVPQCGGPDRSGLEVGVGHLIGHSQREGQVGEIELRRWFSLVEVDPAPMVRVVQERIPGGVDGVHH